MPGAFRIMIFSSSDKREQSVSSRGGAARWAVTASVVAVSVVLSACGGGKKESATQVAARVNDGEISVHQINQVLQRQPGLKPEQVGGASKRVLEGLVDQELAIQQALAQKLDHEPATVMAIESARREILARAYMDKLAAGVTKPSDAEVQKYYNEHPELFAQRKMYALQEVSVEVQGDAARKAQVASQFRDARSVADLTSRLSAAGLKFQLRSTSQAAEGLPLGLLGQLAKLSDGEILSAAGPAGLTFIAVVNTKLAPVSLETAKAAITTYLMNDQRRKLTMDEVKRLRTAAKIEYMGQFAQGAASGSAPAAAPAAAPASAGLDGAALQKGLSGLK